MRVFAVSVTVLALAACGGPGRIPLLGDTPTSGPTLSTRGDVRVGGGYRNPQDPCKRADVTALTAEFASPETDLVACPVDFDGRPAFIRATAAREATRTSEWVVYIIPLVGEAPVMQIPPAGPVTGQGVTPEAPAET